MTGPSDGALPRPRLPEDDRVGQHSSVGEQSSVGKHSPANGRPWATRFAALRESLLPSDDTAPATRRAWLVGVCAVLAGTVVHLLRIPGPGALDSIWAEDGYIFLTEAWRYPLERELFKPVNGYFLFVPRFLTAAVAWAPPLVVPALMAIEAALVTSLLALAVYCATRPHLRHPVARLVASAPVVAVPVAVVSDNLATLQFVALYASMWMVLWSPRRWLPRLSALIVVFGTAITTILCVLLAPLVLLRLALRRDRFGALLTLALVPGVLGQTLPLMFGWTERGQISWPNYSPAWIAEVYLWWGLPRTVFGLSWPQVEPLDPAGRRAATIAVVVGLLGAVAIAALRVTRPAWAVAVTVWVFGTVTFAFTTMAQGTVEQRYLVVPWLTTMAALAALTQPRDEPGARFGVGPLTAVATVALLVCTANLRPWDDRATSPRWSDQLAKARIECATGTGPVAVVRTASTGPWRVEVPCDRLE